MDGLTLELRETGTPIILNSGDTVTKEHSYLTLLRPSPCDLRILPRPLCSTITVVITPTIHVDLGTSPSTYLTSPGPSLLLGNVNISLNIKVSRK